MPQVTESLHIRPEGVEKMFPVSFERSGTRYNRVLSEENLVDWFRSVTSNSANSTKNSPYSYVLTDNLSETFGATNSVVSFLEFVIGGYYVKLTDVAVEGVNAAVCDIYAVIFETSDKVFRSLRGGELSSDNKFTALELYPVGLGETLELPEQTESYFKLHILTKENDKYTIPTDSKRATSAVDGGELD